MLEQYALSDRLTLRCGYDQVNKSSLGLLANHLSRITAPRPIALTDQNLHQNCPAVISLLIENRSENEQWSTADAGTPVCYRFCHMHLTKNFGMHVRGPIRHPDAVRSGCHYPRLIPLTDGSGVDKGGPIRGPDIAGSDYHPSVPCLSSVAPE